MAADECPFCPGNESHTPPEIAAYRKDGSSRRRSGMERARRSRDRSLLRGRARASVREGVGLYDKVARAGRPSSSSRVLTTIVSPAGMDEAQWEQVLWMYRDRLRDLKKDQAIRDILITRRYQKPGSRIQPSVFAGGGGAGHLRRRPTPADPVPRLLRIQAPLRLLRYHPPGDRRRGARDSPDASFRGLAPTRARSPTRPGSCRASTPAPTSRRSRRTRRRTWPALLRGHFKTLAVVPGDPSFEMVLYTAPNQAAKLLPGNGRRIADDYHWHLEITPSPDRLSRIGGIHVNEHASGGGRPTAPRRLERLDQAQGWVAIRS